MNPRPPDEHPPTSRIRWGRIAFLGLVYGSILLAGHYSGHWLSQWLGFVPGTAPSLKAKRIVWTALGAYAVLLAMPFVPGIEISMALFAAFGSAVAVHIYVATVVALSIAFVVGRLVPPSVMVAIFRALGLQSAEDLVLRLAPLSPKERLETLTAHAPSRYAPLLLRYRYVALALVLNTPGNAVLGGGGGIALLAGMSGLFSFPIYFLAIAIAALPVPLASLLAGRIF